MTTMQDAPESVGDISQRLRGTKPGAGEVAAARERAGAKAEDQLALDEHVIEDAEVEQALEERQKRRDSLGAVRKLADAADELAKAAIAKLELPEGGVVRVGRFRIARQALPERSVTFTAKASSRVRISLIKEA